MHASFELNPRLLSQVGVTDRPAVAVKRSRMLQNAWRREEDRASGGRPGGNWYSPS